MTDIVERTYRNGAHLMEVAKSLGWPDDGEGALEFIMRRTREVALEDARSSGEITRLRAALREIDHGWENPMDDKGYRALARFMWETARAAFEAMVEAWPMKQHRAWDDVLGLGLILLLPLTENPDGE